MTEVYRVRQSKVEPDKYVVEQRYATHDWFGRFKKYEWKVADGHPKDAYWDYAAFRTKQNAIDWITTIQTEYHL